MLLVVGMGLKHLRIELLMLAILSKFETIRQLTMS